MKVLHVLDHSRPLVDGYCVRSRCIVDFQRELGLDPVVVTSARQSDKYGDDYRGELETLGDVRYHRTPSAPESGLPLVPEFQRLRRMTRRIEEVVRSEQPDVLHAHSPCLWGLAAGRVAKRNGLPLVYEIRGFWEDALVDSGKTVEGSFKYGLIRRTETGVCRRARVVTTIAEGLKDDIVSRGLPADRVMMIPNGVASDQFVPQEPDEKLRSELGLDGRTLVGYVGSLFSWEGVEDLVRAVPAIVAEHPQAAIVILGGGERRETIEGLIRQLGVESAVLMVGRVPHEEVARYYSILDVLVYPRISTRNTELCTPLKPLEAMAMEKAVVGSSVGGVRELIADGTGLVFDAGSPQDLAAKCSQLIADKNLRDTLGRAAREYVIRERNWRSIAARYFAVYEAATGTPMQPSVSAVLSDQPVAVAGV